MEKRVIGFATALLWTSALCTPVTVLAQTASAADDTASTDGTDIVVTAQKRAQSLQTVPASVQAITGEGLEARSLRTLQDYARFVPGMQATPTGANGFNNIVLRGITATGGGQPPTVITYLDDLLIPNTLDAQIYDIARIEVLKGPQGDLYGASSAGGLIRYVSAAPDYETVSGRVEASASTTSDGDPSYGGAGVINLPLSSGAALRASVVYDHTGGFIDNFNPFTGQTQKDVDSQDRLTARVSLALQPTDALEIIINGLYNNRTVDAFNDVDDAPFLRRNAASDRTSVRFKDEFLKDESWIVNGSINYDAGFGTFTSATGYFKQRQDIDFDTSGLNFYDPARFGGFSFPGFDPRVNGPFGTNPRNALINVTHRVQTQKQFTQEIRFASDWDFPIQALVGGFYLDGTLEDNYYLDFTQPIPDFGSLFNPALASTATILIDYNDRAKFKEKAAFANLSWKFADDRGEIKVGARTFSRTSDRVITDGPGPLLFNYGQRGGGKSTGELYSVTGSFQITRELFAYARYSEGFRPGQLRALPPAVCDADIRALGLDRATLSSFTDPEALENIEGGVRFSTADRRLTANVTGFRIKYDGIQQTIRLPGCSSSIVANGGSATSQGFEVSIALSPVAGLTFNADVGYTDSTFDTSNPALGIDAGEQLQYVPKWTAAVRADYTFPLSETLDGIVRGDITFTDKRQTDFGGSGSGPALIEALPAFELVGLQAGVATEKWELMATVSNLFDVTPVYNNNVVLYGAVGGRTFSIGRPRTIGARLTYNF